MREEGVREALSEQLFTDLAGRGSAIFNMWFQRSPENQH